MGEHSYLHDMILTCLFFLTTSAWQVWGIYNNVNTTEGILISGGDDSSVEVFNPTTGQSCELPSLPYQRSGHTMDGMTVCGGVFTGNGNTCITFSSGEWVNSHALAQDRSDHCSWSTRDGIMLLGGDMWDSQTTTETVRLGEFDSQLGFTLQYRTAHACSINDLTTDTLIITGGNETLRIVTRYDALGYVEDLPSLQEGRYGHGCGAYLREDRTQVLLVAGGAPGYLSSTEILANPSSDWVLTTNLPRRMHGLIGASVAGVLYMTGGYNGLSSDPEESWIDEVYKWTRNDWVEVGKMKKTRSNHAVSTIMLEEEVMQYCG